MRCAGSAGHQGVVLRLVYGGLGGLRLAQPRVDAGKRRISLSFLGDSSYPKPPSVRLAPCCAAHDAAVQWRQAERGGLVQVVIEDQKGWGTFLARRGPGLHLQRPLHSMPSACPTCSWW